MRIEITGYAKPAVAASREIDALECLVRVHAPPLDGDFTLDVPALDLHAVGAYLAGINSGNGPPGSFSMASGLFTLSFAPSRRGPVLCAALIKSIEASHARLEFMIALEPRDITEALGGFALLPPPA